MEHKIIRHLTEGLSASERSRFIKQINSDTSLKKEYIRIKNLYALSELREQAYDKDTVRKSFNHFIKKYKAHKRRKLFYSIASTAAILLLVISSSVFLTLHYLAKDKKTLHATNTLYVPAGQRAQLTLQDGTVVWLNAKSTLTYPASFTGEKREVNLIGEAFFDVVKDNGKPFIVSSSNMRIEVLGTQFNVYNYEENIFQTSLLEGSVKVYPQEKPDYNVVLKPNEQLTIENGKTSVANISNKEHFLWKDGIYSFENEKLIDIIDKLRLYYDVTIKVEKPKLFDVLYTGKFRQRDGIDEILNIIKKIQDFEIERDKENNQITLKTKTKCL